jgi:agmatinase
MPANAGSTRIGLLGVPYDGSSSYQAGAAKAPAAIRAALRNESSNGWNEAVQNVLAEGVLEDFGDAALPASGSPRTAIEAAMSKVLDQGAKPIVLGGDHSITYPLLRALGPRCKRLTVLHVDAHPDLYEEFEGDKYSHACPFARVMEDGLAHRLVQVGIRTLNAGQEAQARRYGVEMITMQDWRDGWRLESDGPVYLSFDFDGLDPAFAPGISHPEPGGLSTRQVIGIIQGISGELVGADLVELNPDNDFRDLTARVGAKLIKEVVAKMR